MNTTYVERTVLQEAVAALERYGMEVKVWDESELGVHDAKLAIRYRDQKSTFDVQIRLNINNGLIARRAEIGGTSELLVVPHVSATQAQLCRRLGVRFLDASGNMSLTFDQGFVEVTGQKRKADTVLLAPREERMAVRAFQPSGLRVIFVLLCEGAIANAPYRDIAQLSGSSLGTVGWVMAELINDGYVESYGRQRTLHKSGELLDRWTEAYSSALFPKLWLGRFQPESAGEWNRGAVPIHDAPAWWGGESAAVKTGIKLRSATATLYVDDLPPRLIGKYKLRRNDNAGSLTFRQRFWGDELVDGDVVPDVLIYADMIASGDPRQIESASEIRERMNQIA